MRMNYRIPFNKPCLAGNEMKYVAQAIKMGHTSGDGYFTKKCQALLEEALGIKKVFLTPSCTQALEMCALLLDLKAGDEIIVPSFTFVSTVNAFILRGAKPVFIDIRPDTLNLDENRLEKLITRRTRAIVPVHYAGVGCEMDRILRIADKHGIPVIEDNAHGLFGKYKDRYLGSLGRLGALSFHETKNFICGEGGALLVNDEKLIQRAEIIREKGTNRNRFLRGEIDKYTWVDVGSSYLPSDILAAFLYAQLEARSAILKERKRVWEYYFRHLRVWALTNDILLPSVPQNCRQSYHMFYLILPSIRHRDAVIARLKKKGILSVFHYVPLHLSPMGRKWGYQDGDLPATEDISERLLRLPFYNTLTTVNLREIVDALCDGQKTKPGRARGQSRSLLKT